MTSVSVVSVLSKTPNLLKELRKVLPNVQFHEVQNPDQDPHFRESPVLISDFDLLGKYLYDLPKTKWVQGTWAGADKLFQAIKKDKPVPFPITRFTGEHFGRIMGEYVIANIINHERDFGALKKYQEKGVWYTGGRVCDYRIISDLTVGILGLGNIGSRIGKLLHLLGAKILAFGRRSSLPNGTEYDHVTKYYTREKLKDFLEECDYIISILPKTNETDGLLDNDILKNCTGRGSVLINIGRSNIISEDSIVKAIKNKWISAAILDVFDVEPLPESSPLWRMDQVFVTPHVSGMTRAKDVAEQFASNYDLFTKNLPLPAIIDITRGY